MTARAKGSRLGNVALTDVPATADAVRSVHAAHAAAAAPRADTLRAVPAGDLSRSPWQPREAMDAARLDELADSVRARGVLEPLLARERPDGSLELLAGERRLEAARRAGLATVPVRVLAGLSDAEAREVAVVENLARADLTVWDEARALLALRDARRAEGKPHDVRALAAAAGRSKSVTGRRLRVAERLTPDVIAAVRAALGASVPTWDALADNAVALEASAEAEAPGERARVLVAAAGAAAPGVAAHAARHRPQTDPTARDPMEGAESAGPHGGTPDGGPAPTTYALTGGADTRVRLTIRGPVAVLSVADARRLARELRPLLAAVRARAKDAPKRPAKRAAGGPRGAGAARPDALDSLPLPFSGPVEPLP